MSETEQPLFTESDRETFKNAVDTWGLEAQVDMAVEEMGEAIVALQQYQRGRNDLEDVVDELADVRIMYEQLALFFDEQAVEERVSYKMGRLKGRLRGAQE